ncbi:BTAD domain-containing putative transcriptional regulator [Streptomyces chiangmaiensis]|uniref:BTAD domain-containing putative transcriptional regulator n=1 Tax=Streptomyces chiangmaiensis TaxID=766497 RepID=A0ABU7FQI2_9ACTN|nr:BTAD domain-containing putative transcriptional regulator [Streptomyces chiangmaiensis]MED7826352.1 BTAD domain-containing putative transcriptional regulator [Streptomyces chiangmaiensis]
MIRSGKDWYRSVVDGVRLDTADLGERGNAAMRAVASGHLATAADQLPAASELFRGEPLGGLPGPYAQNERHRLEERRRTLRMERLK